MTSRHVKASRAVPVTALVAFSLAFAAACSNDRGTVTADCAAKQKDGSYKAVADSYCDNHRSSGGHGGGGFVWIYGGSHASNGTVTGGTLTRPQNTNISSRTPTGVQHTPGEYGAEGHVYQEFWPLPDFDGWHPVLGAWVVGDEAAGLGIRETRGLITDNTSSFVPHLITDATGLGVWA